MQGEAARGAGAGETEEDTGEGDSESEEDEDLKSVKEVRGFACTRYCHHQYCMVYGIQKGGRCGGVYGEIDVQ